MPCPAQVAPSAGPDLSPSLPDRYVLAVGSLIARKGYDVLVKAMGLVRDRGHNLNLVIVGADRIAANGDVANKIGTYGLAVLARHHGVPFYCAAPWSSVDTTLAEGDLIPIEQRAEAEVTMLAGRRAAPEGMPALNPAFDVTPARYVTGFITDRGIVQPPFGN